MYVLGGIRKNTFLGFQGLFFFNFPICVFYSSPPNLIPGYASVSHQGFWPIPLSEMSAKNVFLDGSPKGIYKNIFWSEFLSILQSQQQKINISYEWLNEKFAWISHLTNTKNYYGGQFCRSQSGSNSKGTILIWKETRFWVRSPMDKNKIFLFQLDLAVLR